MVNRSWVLGVIVSAMIVAVILYEHLMREGLL